MIFVSLVFLGIIAAAPAAKLPDKFQRCKRATPDFSECLTNAIQTSLPYLKKGVPNLGLIPIDPLRITKLDINEGDGPVAIDLKFRETDIKNIATAKINRATIDIEKYYMEIDATLKDPLILDGDYEINGKVLILPITGKGKAYIELENLHAILKIQGRESKKDGQIYMEMADLKMNFDTTKMKIKLDNLFNNDRALGDNMNAFLNDNWKEILNELKPAIEGGLSAAFKEIARRLFDKVPFDDIFLK